MLKEVIGNGMRQLGNTLAPKPSETLEKFNTSVLRGKEPQIAVYGQTQEVDIQCYGIIEGEERERIRFLWRNFEKSYFITIGSDGNISVFLEGFYQR